MGAPTTNFLQHNPTAANQESDASYVVDSTRTSGLTTNQLVPSVWLNKILFQVSTFIAAFAQMMVNKGYTLLDSNFSTLATVLAAVVTMKDWTSGNNAYGYWEKNPVGRIRQWGLYTGDIAGGTVNITFPKPFTNLASVSVTVSTYASYYRTTYIVTGSITLTGFQMANTGGPAGASWSADGY